MKKITKIHRILIGSILPAPLGVVYILSRWFLEEGSTDNMFFYRLIIFTGIAYMLIGIPCIMYSFIIEFANHKINNNFVVVGISILLGVLVACFTEYITGFDDFIHMGVIIGLFCGLILRGLYVRTTNISINGKQNR